jgi:pilus assembly protein CpaC
MVQHKPSLTIWLYIGVLLTALLWVKESLAAERYITLNEGKHVQLPMAIGKVFISNPDVADYKIINDTTLVVFASGVGHSRLIVYGTNDDVLLSDRIIVDVDLQQVRRQIAFYFPDAEVKLESIGTQVAVSGVVDSEQTRDDIYRMVAMLLGREKTERWESSQRLSYSAEGVSLQEPDSMIFARNMMWEGIIERLEVATVQQVNVKISVAQVTESFGETVGVDWSGINVGEFLFEQFEAGEITTLITALGNDSIAEVLAEPNLTVVSGESASFLVGGEVPVILTTNNNVNITFKEYGVRLDLTAKVHSKDRIRMQLLPEVSEIEGYVTAEGQLQVPQIASRRAMTTIELADGESFVLGGLMSSADFEEMQKTPLIGDIPILGAAFRKSITERRRTELIIVATVNLVKPMKPTDIQLPYIKKTSTLARWFNLDSKDEDTRPSNATLRLLSDGGFIQ